MGSLGLSVLLVVCAKALAMEEGTSLEDRWWWCMECCECIKWPSSGHVPMILLCAVYGVCA